MYASIFFLIITNTNTHLMMTNILLPALTCFVLLSSGLCLAAREQEAACAQIEKITAQKPSQSIQAQGGFTDFWDYKNEQFECAGVSIRRHRIQPKGLLLPLYHNAPVLVYAVQGRGKLGVLAPGCPETYGASQQLGHDVHQKIESIRQGDITAIPAGAAHWAYNDGYQEDLVLVVVHHNANSANQLDLNPRSFFLAGNPESGRARFGQQEEFGNNLFNGFTVETLAEAFGTDLETASQLQGQQDPRGHIVTVQRGFRLITPPEEYNTAANDGLEETNICTAKIRENIDQPSRADIYNARAGRYTTANSFSLPILRFLQISAARGVLRKNGMMSPHWYQNAHSIIYVTRGESRMQIVNDLGQSVFHGRVQEGQVVVVPQNFAVAKQAGEQGCEWVAFNTNENAVIHTLSGRTSALRGLPADVIAVAYNISTNEAERLKSSRQETIIFSGSRRNGNVASA